MKKARIALIFLSLFATLGGVMAFEAKRFNGSPIWIPTEYVSIVAGGRTYAVYGNLYTTAGATLFFSTIGSPAIVFKTTTSLPPLWVIATATDGSGYTRSMLTYSPTLTLTIVTTVN